MAVTSWDQVVRGVAVTLAQLASPGGKVCDAPVAAGGLGRDYPASARVRPGVSPAAGIGAETNIASGIEVDIEVAVTARAAVLAGAAAVLRDLLPSVPQLRGSDLDLLAMAERDPIRAFGVVLHNRGRPQVSRPPSELLDAALGGSPASCRWAGAGREALQADRIWSALMQPLEDDQAWHALAQVAAIAELIGTLDPALTRLATQASRPDLVAYLDRSAGLRIAAREVRALTAASGEGRAAVNPRVGVGGPGPRRIVVPTDGHTANVALRRLTVLVKDTPTLGPQQVRSIATLGRDLTILAATAGATTGSGEPGREHLGALATELQRVVAGRHGEATLIEHSGRALEHQVRELARYTRAALADRAPRPAAEEASRLVSRLPRLLTILGHRAWEQVERRDWAIPDRSERSHLHYAIATAHNPDRAPRMLLQLDRAIAAAQELRVPPSQQVGAAISAAAVAGHAHSPGPSVGHRSLPSLPTSAADGHLPPSA